MSDYLTTNQSDLLQVSNCVKTTSDTAPIPIKSPRNRRWQRPSSTENLLTNCEDDDGAFSSGETSPEFCYKKLRNSATQTPPLKFLLEDNGTENYFKRRSLGPVEVDYRRTASNFGGRVSSNRDIEFEKFLSSQRDECYDDTKPDSKGTWGMSSKGPEPFSGSAPLTPGAHLNQGRFSIPGNKLKLIKQNVHSFDEFEHSEPMGTWRMPLDELDPFSESAPSTPGAHLSQRRFSNPGNKTKLIREQNIRNFDEFEHSESMGTWGLPLDEPDPFSESAPSTPDAHLNQRRLSNPGKKIPEQTFQTYAEFKKSKSVKTWGTLPEDNDSLPLSPSTPRRYSNPHSQTKLIRERGDRSFDEFLERRRTTDWKEMGKELRHIADDLKMAPLNSKKSESLWRLVYRSFIGNSLEPNRRRSQSSGSLPRRK